MADLENLRAQYREGLSSLGVDTASQDKMAGLLDAKERKLGSLSKTLLSDPFDDADSSKHIRISGLDTPETYHESDLHNERTKVFKQLAHLRPDLSPREATEEAERQMQIYADMKKQGIDLADQFATWRKNEDISEDYKPTVFDIFHAGEAAVKYSDEDSKTHPTTGKQRSADFLTGEKGYFGRNLADNTEYANRMIAEGYAIPGASGSAYNEQVEAMNKAKDEEKGVYATEMGRKVMDAIYQTSSAKRYAERKGPKTVGEMLHYESPEKFQESVGEQLTYQVHRDGKGGFFEFAKNDDGSIKKDEYGEEIKIAVPKEDVEAVYIGEGKAPIHGKKVFKFGLASADLKPEYLELWKDKGPEFVARYVNKFEVNPYNYEYKYDGTPGPLGVDLDKGAMMSVLMRKGRAKHLEKYVHTHAGQVRERAAGNVALLSDAKTAAEHEAKFGSGVSEYSFGDSPLFNVDYDMSKVDALQLEVLEEPMPTTAKEWNKIKQKWKQDKDRLDTLEKHDTDGVLGETIDYFQASLLRFLGTSHVAMRGGIESLSEALGMPERDVIRFSARHMYKIAETPIDELAKQEVADKAAGVKSTTRKEFQKDQQKAIKDIENGKYGKAALSIVKNVHLYIADSAGETLALATLPTAALAVAGRVSQQAKEYEKNNGKPPSEEWYLGSTVAEATVLFGERLILGKALKGALKKEMTGSIGAAAARKAKDYGEAMAGEALQEGAETVKEEYFTQKGAFTDDAEKSLQEIVVSPETQLAAMAASTSVGTLKAAGDMTVPTASKAYGKVFGKSVDLTSEEGRLAAIADIKTTADKEMFDLEISSNAELNSELIENLNNTKPLINSIRDQASLEEVLSSSKDLADIVSANAPVMEFLSTFGTAENIDNQSIKQVRQALTDTVDMTVNDLTVRSKLLDKTRRDLEEQISKGKITLTEVTTINPFEGMEDTEDTGTIVKDLDTIFSTNQSTIGAIHQAIKNTENLGLDSDSKQGVFVEGLKKALVHNTNDKDSIKEINKLSTIEEVEAFVSGLRTSESKELGKVSEKDAEASAKRKRGAVKRLVDLSLRVVSLNKFKAIKDKDKALKTLEDRIGSLNNSEFAVLAKNSNNSAKTLQKAFEGLDGYVTLSESDAVRLIENEKKLRDKAKAARGKVKVSPKEVFESDSGLVIGDIIGFVRDEVMPAKKAMKELEHADITEPLTFKGTTYKNLSEVEKGISDLFTARLKRAPLSTLESFRRATDIQKKTQLDILRLGQAAADPEGALAAYNQLLDDIIKTKHASGRSNLKALKNRVVYAINNAEGTQTADQVKSVKEELEHLKKKKAISEKEYGTLKKKLGIIELENKKKFDEERARADKEFKETLNSFLDSSNVPEAVKEAVMNEPDDDKRKEIIESSPFTAKAIERLAAEFLEANDIQFENDDGLIAFIKALKEQEGLIC